MAMTLEVIYPARMRPEVMAGSGMSLGLEQC